MVGKPLIFIVGVGRSGTSLLQSMLHAHPSICFLPETAFIRRYLATGSLARRLKKHGPQAVAARLLGDERFARLDFEAQAMTALIPQEAAQLPKLYPALMELYAQGENGDTRTDLFLGDKDPRNAEYLPWIARHYPNAHVVHIFRDPRDVLASKKKAAWSRGRSLFYHSFAGRVQFHLASYWGKRLFGQRYTEICYEQLIENPREILGSLCEKLNIKYDDAMEHFGEAGKALVAPDEMAWKKETLGPLLASNRDKWRQALDPFEVAVTEKVCSEVMAAGAYSKGSSPVSLLQGMILLVLPLPFALVGYVYGVYRQWKQRS